MPNPELSDMVISIARPPGSCKLNTYSLFDSAEDGTETVMSLPLSTWVVYLMSFFCFS